MNPFNTAALLFLLAAATTASAQTKPAKMAAAAAPAIEAAVPLLHAGLWETAIVEQAPGTTNKRTTTSRTCYSTADVKALERIVPQQREFGMKCENRDIKAQGAAVSWKVSCTGKEGTRAGLAKMTLGSDSYEGQAKLDLKLNGKASKVDQTIVGKRVGDCS